REGMGRASLHGGGSEPSRPRHFSRARRGVRTPHDARRWEVARPLHQPRDEDRHRDVQAHGLRAPARNCARLWHGGRTLPVDSVNSVIPSRVGPNMKRILLAALLFLSSIFPVAAQEYYDIDVDLPQYPEMLPVPDSPVYYAPSVDSNYFYYDGQYWDY